MLFTVPVFWVDKLASREFFSLFYVVSLQISGAISSFRYLLLEMTKRIFSWWIFIVDSLKSDLIFYWKIGRATSNFETATFFAAFFWVNNWKRGLLVENAVNANNVVKWKYRSYITQKRLYIAVKSLPYAPPLGLEPRTLWLTVRCSNQLS